MKFLNESYNTSCVPNYRRYKKITNDITLIDNFFADFSSARNFFETRDKWQCISYQKNSKPGCESVFPFCVGMSLMERYILDNEIIDDTNSYETVCNFFYNESSPIRTLSSTTYFPHIDRVENDDVLEHICLINLNKIPVSTKFYTYKNRQFCSRKNEPEWIALNKRINVELQNFYNKPNITKEEAKIFLDKQNLDIKLINTVEYKPNQAIVYPANLFHSPKITQEFTEDNPRILLRITFDRKVKVSKNICYD